MKPITQSFICVRDSLMQLEEGKAEIEHVQKVLDEGLEGIKPWFFYKQYVFVVLCSGWKEQYAHREWDACFINSWDDPGVNPDFSKISNTRKREAAITGYANYQKWYQDLLDAPDKFIYLDSLPMIGEVTCRHLARNTGIDTVKPDRHMTRVASEFGYGYSEKVPEQIVIIEKMCRDIQNELDKPEYIGVIDVILWRACNLGWL